MNISKNDLKMSSLQLKAIVPIPIPSLLLHFPSLVTWGEWKEYIRHIKKNITWVDYEDLILYFCKVSKPLEFITF